MPASFLPHLPQPMREMAWTDVLLMFAIMAAIPVLCIFALIVVLWP